MAVPTIRTRLGLTLSAAALIAGATAASAAAASVPGQPQDVQAKPLSSTTVHIAWDYVSGVTYLITDGNETRSIKSGDHSYTWGGFSTGTYVCFAVIAGNSSGWGPWSPYSCVTTP